MAGNPFGSNGMVRPGPHTGSTFAGGSFSPRRRMIEPTTSTTTSPAAAMSMPGKRTGWGGKPLPPGQMKRLGSSKGLNAHWAAIAQAAGLMPGTTPAAGTAATHGMPDGSSMPGAAHMPTFPTQAQVPMQGFMPPGLARRVGLGRRIIGQPVAPASSTLPQGYGQKQDFLGGMENFPLVY